MNRKIENIEEFIEHTKLYQIENPMRSIQSDIEDNQYDREFTEYLCGIAEHIHPQELKGVARQTTTLSWQEICEKINAKNSLKAGIKINHFPYWKTYEWEKWEDGYIEGFVRIADFKGPDYFIWTYIRMKHLREILTKWGDKLIYYF